MSLNKQGAISDLTAYEKLNIFVLEQSILLGLDQAAHETNQASQSL